MVLISITSDPNDFLSAPPPGGPRTIHKHRPYKSIPDPLLFPSSKSALFNIDEVTFAINSNTLSLMGNAHKKKPKSESKEQMKMLRELDAEGVPDTMTEAEVFPTVDTYSSDSDYYHRKVKRDEYLQLEEKLAQIYSPVESSFVGELHQESLGEAVAESKKEKTQKRKSSGKSEQEEVGEYDRQELLKDIPLCSGGKTQGITLLMSACQQGLEHDVRDILRRKPNMARVDDSTGKTALHYCAENQNTSCIEQILALEPNLLDKGDNEGYTPLHLAVISGNKIIIKFLLSKGANIDALDIEKHSAIHWAIVCGELEALDVLCNAGADMNTPDIHEAYPIHYAAQMCGPSSESSSTNSRISLVGLRKLLMRGVDPNVVDKDGRPPLLWAASAGSTDAILALVNAGATTDPVDKDGLAAIHCAASRGQKECLEVLITLCGALVNLTDWNGCSPLFYTVTLGHLECTEMLLECGASPNLMDRKGRTPVHCGAAKGQLETVKVLQKYKAKMWEKNLKGDIPLHDAVQSGRKDLVKWFLVLNPSAVNEPNKEGRCSIHISAFNNSLDICDILAEYGADFNPIMRNHNGQFVTPLDIAISRGNKASIKFIKLNGGIRAVKLTNRYALRKALLRGLSNSKYSGVSEGGDILTNNSDEYRRDRFLSQNSSSQRHDENNEKINVSPSSTIQRFNDNLAHIQTNLKHKPCNESSESEFSDQEVRKMKILRKTRLDKRSPRSISNIQPLSDIDMNSKNQLNDKSKMSLPTLGADEKVRNYLEKKDVPVESNDQIRVKGSKLDHEEITDKSNEKRVDSDFGAENNTSDIPNITVLGVGNSVHNKQKEKSEILSPESERDNQDRYVNNDYRKSFSLKERIAPLFHPSYTFIEAYKDPINDETIGKSFIIEKHLEHQRLLKEGIQNINSNTCLGLSKTIGSQQYETDNFSTDHNSGYFVTEANSEVFVLNGSMRMRPRGSLVRASQAEQRKFQIEKVLMAELLELKEVQIRTPITCAAVAAKRMIDSFNKKIVNYVGVRTYSGSFTFQDFENHLFGELSKTQMSSPYNLPNLRGGQNQRLSHLKKRSQSHNGRPSRRQGECNSMGSSCSHPRSVLGAVSLSQEQPLILPMIRSGMSTPYKQNMKPDKNVLEVRHGNSTQYIRFHNWIINI